MKSIAKVSQSVSTVFDALGVSVALQFNTGMTTTQEYINDYGEHIPDYALSPLVITPIATVNDPSGTLSYLSTDNVILRDDVTNIKWWLVKDTGKEEITSSVGGDYTISTSGATKGQLTCRKNLNVNSGRTLMFTCDFKDERTGQYQTITKSVSLTCTASTQTMLKSRLFATKGTSFGYKDVSMQLLHKLFLGDTELLYDVARWWYKDNVLITSANANGITGYDSNTLNVPTSLIGDGEAEIKCIADRIDDANILYGVLGGFAYTPTGNPIYSSVPHMLTNDRLKGMGVYNLSFKLNASNVVAKSEADAQVCLGTNISPNYTFDYDTNGWNGSDTLGGKISYNSTDKCMILTAITAAGAYVYTSVAGVKWRKVKFKARSSNMTSIPDTYFEGNGASVKYISRPALSSVWQDYEYDVCTSNVFLFKANGAIGNMIEFDNVSIQEIITVNSNLVNGGDFQSGLVGSIGLGSGGVVATYELNTVSPIRGTQDGRLRVTTSGIFNNRPAIQLGTTNHIINRNYRVSFDYKVNAGTCKLNYINNGISEIAIGQTLSGKGTFKTNLLVLGTSEIKLCFDGTNLFDLQIDNIEITEYVEPRVFCKMALKDKSGNEVLMQVQRKFANDSTTTSIVNENVNALVTLPQSGAPYTLADTTGQGTAGVQGIASGTINVSELQLTKTDAQVTYHPSPLDGYKPASPSANAFTEKALLKYKIEDIIAKIESPAGVPPSVKMINPRIVMMNNQGVITNPQNRFSFLWKDSVGTEIGRGSNIMLPVNASKSDLLKSFSVEPYLGMDYVKYMCCPDGIDDGLSGSTVGLYDCALDTETNEVILDFIRGDSANSYTPLMSDNSIAVFRYGPWIYVRKNNNDGSTYRELKIGLGTLVIGKRYVIRIKFTGTISGIDSVECSVNGIKKTVDSYNPSITASWSTALNISSAWGTYTNDKFISIKVIGKSGSIIHNWDFSGTTIAERLKDKVGTLNLNASNISDLNAFFQPL